MNFCFFIYTSMWYRKRSVSSASNQPKIIQSFFNKPENLRNKKYFNSFYLNVLYKVASFCKWTCKCFLSFLFCFLLLFNLMFLLFLVYYCHYYLLLICCFYVYFIFSFVFALLCIISGVALSLHLKFLAWFQCFRNK